MEKTWFTRKHMFVEQIDKSRSTEGSFYTDTRTLCSYSDTCKQD